MYQYLIINIIVFKTILSLLFYKAQCLLSVIDVLVLLDIFTIFKSIFII